MSIAMMRVLRSSFCDGRRASSQRPGMIASLIARALRERETPESLPVVKAEVAELCAKFPPYPDGV